MGWILWLTKIGMELVISDCALVASHTIHLSLNVGAFATTKALMLTALHELVASSVAKNPEARVFGASSHPRSPCLV